MASIQLKNNATTTLLTAISAADVGLVVAYGDGTLFPSLSGGNWFYVTIEDTEGTTTAAAIRRYDVSSELSTSVFPDDALREYIPPPPQCQSHLTAPETTGAAGVKGQQRLRRPLAADAIRPDTPAGYVGPGIQTSTR